MRAYQPGGEACLLVDAYLPGMSGLDLLHRLHDLGHRLLAIMITGSSDVQMAVEAMKAGALDFIEKPIIAGDLIAGVNRALNQSSDSRKQEVWRESAATNLNALTTRQRQIMEMVLAGHPSKNIATDLKISQRTVESHRGAIMKKTGCKSLPALARLALAAAWELIHLAAFIVASSPAFFNFSKPAFRLRSIADRRAEAFGRLDSFDSWRASRSNMRAHLMFCPTRGLNVWIIPEAVISQANISAKLALGPALICE